MGARGLCGAACCRGACGWTFQRHRAASGCIVTQRLASDFVDPEDCGRLIDGLDADMLATGVFLCDRKGSYLLERGDSLVAEVDDWLDDSWGLPDSVGEQQIADARETAERYDTAWDAIEDDPDILVDVDDNELLWLERLPTALTEKLEEVLCKMHDSRYGAYRLSEMAARSDEAWRHVAAWLHTDPAELAMLAMDPVEHVRQRAAWRLKQLEERGDVHLG